MDVRAMLSKTQRLRRQLVELEAKADATRQMLEQLNKALKQAMKESDQAVAELSEAEFQAMLTEFNDPKHISVEVVYATRDKQQISEIQLSQGATVEDGIMVSGILEQFPEIDLASFKVGVHGSLKALSHTVQEGDRIELYRPVAASPAS